MHHHEPKKRIGIRLLAGVVATAALAVPMAGQAHAVPGTKRLHTQANTGRFLTMIDNFAAGFPQSVTSTNEFSQWFVEPFGSSLRIRNAGGDRNHCLKAGIAAGAVATVRPCDGSDPRQQWQINSGALSANNGLRAELLVSGNAQGIRMVSSLAFPPPPNQNWHLHNSPS